MAIKLNAAIIDDDEVFSKSLEEKLKAFAAEHEIMLNSRSFPNGRTFLEEYKKDSYDVVFLDVEMPEMNGMKTAGRIREKDKDIPLIFVTNVAQYAVQSYEFNAYDYILKPVNYYALNLKLTSLVKKIQREKNQKIALKIGSSLQIMEVGNILYIEVFKHTLIFHTLKRNITTTGKMTLSQLEEQLKPYHFSKCSQYYLVNLMHVKRNDDQSITVGDDVLQISKRRREQFLMDMLNYYN